PHTAPLGLPDRFARRIARNTQLLLLEESNLARVADPAAGSGALEAITQGLCIAAWSLFQEIEKAGGVWSALENGKLQQRVAAVRAQRQDAVARGADILTGTNHFPDLHETLPGVLGVTPQAPPSEGGAAAAVTTTALPRIRLAEPFERLRDASDRILQQTGTRPKIFLAALGTAADFTTRAAFAKSFFEAGGIEAASHEGTPSALGAAFQTSGAALACLCASDTVDDNEAAAAAAALNAAGARHIYLTRRPGARAAAFRKAGIESFIHGGCDALGVLEAAHRLIAS
ncbi:MAG: methylmalonyl-CoA mutase family protein, partial [Bryobacteraceae bacterium]